MNKTKEILSAGEIFLPAHRWQAPVFLQPV
jgi:hypothetical protein